MCHDAWLFSFSVENVSGILREITESVGHFGMNIVNVFLTTNEYKVCLQLVVALSVSFICLEFLVSDLLPL